MEASARAVQCQAGQRWLQTAVEVVLVQTAIPLASPAAHDPVVYWGNTGGLRCSLYLWLADEETPRQLFFTTTLVEDCGAGKRVRHSYARYHILRTLRQMGLVSS